MHSAPFKIDFSIIENVFVKVKLFVHTSCDWTCFWFHFWNFQDVLTWGAGDNQLDKVKKVENHNIRGNNICHQTIILTYIVQFVSTAVERWSWCALLDLSLAGKMYRRHQREGNTFLTHLNCAMNYTCDVFTSRR